ncbi:unnamed protein product [Paramecium pentaurelia]|uniref:Uncharacterized protein n=1 Tax=Paramecium pentaurelia TaxID=43138 RepID=A0A8S1S3D9_9CILI|nr:unnamed protein product [Paramecium pentaurelia]
MRRRFESGYNQRNQIDKREYAQYLENQIKLKEERNKEDRILDNVKDQFLFQQQPRSRFQIHSIFNNQDLEKRQKLQQLKLEQDIYNYNKMIAEDKKRIKELSKSQQNDSLIVPLKLPKIQTYSQEPQTNKNMNTQVLIVPNTLSKSFVLNTEHSQIQHPIISTLNPYVDLKISPSKIQDQIDQNQLEFQEQKQKEEIRKRNQELEALRKKMHDNYITTRNQITSLVEFIKYNQQQQNQFLVLSRQLNTLMKQDQFQPAYPFLKEELNKQMNNQYFHHNEFLEQVKDELQTSSNYIQFQQIGKVQDYEDLVFEL